MKKTLDLAEKH